ncbi:hypothetical protein XMD564_002265 [Marinobacterium sp. xm-d-564]|nr:hypothetical protein [Marinobacterium sp. xm-d-564]
MPSSPETRTAIRILEAFKAVDPDITLPSMLAFLYYVETDGQAGNQYAMEQRLDMSGATAPTASQIKKIYEDEKVLFQENAACTLYGASDAVTALAHDPDTGLLHVGTSAGRSVFQGLRRVANTTTAVGTAISAVDGLIAEE